MKHELKIAIIAAFTGSVFGGAWLHAAPAVAQSNARTPSVWDNSKIDFSKMSNRPLTDADIDRFIDPRIQGRDRVIVRVLMRHQFPSQRHHFVQDVNGVSYSNLYPLLLSARAQKPVVQIGPRRFVDTQSGETFTTLDFDEPVPQSSPAKASTPQVRPTPTPCKVPGCTTGAFDRVTSAAGYSGVRGYVEEPHCNGLALAPGEAGFIYFGSVSPTGVRYESGLQVNFHSSGITLQAYVRANDFTPPGQKKGTEKLITGGNNLF